MDKPDTFINYTIDMEATGKNIRNLMRITGYSARELERLIGCTQMTFFNWQEGKNLPSFDNLLRLAGILKTPMEKIVVFKKFTVEDLPLKDTNSGFVRNNVFFTYNRATECVVRDCLTFKKKFGVYPDQIILNPKTMENWKNRENEESVLKEPAFMAFSIASLNRLTSTSKSFIVIFPTICKSVFSVKIPAVLNAKLY